MTKRMKKIAVATWCDERQRLCSIKESRWR